MVDALIQDLFAILAYDLDRFRRLVFDPVFLEAYELEAEALEDLKTDDLALLKFSYRFLPTLLSPAGSPKAGRGYPPVHQILRGRLRQGLRTGEDLSESPLCLSFCRERRDRRIS